nr:unnamed protein product [Spirometra erinaceieuropaei]
MINIFLEKQRTRRRRKEWLQNVIEKGEINIDEEEEPEDGVRATSIALISTDAVSETLDQGRTQPGAKRVKTTKALEEDREIKEDEDEPELPEKPSLIFATGKKLIPPLINRFCSRRYTGTPLEEMDDFYRNKRSFVVISGDKTIFRLSLTPSLFVFGPFNPIRLAAIYAMVHPYPFPTLHKACSAF